MLAHVLRRELRTYRLEGAPAIVAIAGNAATADLWRTPLVRAARASGATDLRRLPLIRAARTNGLDDLRRTPIAPSAILAATLVLVVILR
jgi:hypothetical protein